MTNKTNLFFIIFALVFLAACSPKIYGTVELVDTNLKPVEENPEGTVINMINTTEKVENASTSATVNAEGEFESEKKAIVPGIYKVEASRIGYVTETQTVEIGSTTREKLEIKLQKIQEGKRKTITGSDTDADKIINPGEVNIQPPGI